MSDAALSSRDSMLRWLAGWVEAALWTVEHYASEAADRINGWRHRV